MKSEKDVVDTVTKLTSTQIQSIEFMITELTSIKDSNEISETNLKRLKNVYNELDILRDQYFTRILNAIKRGFQLD
jgi:uncharacterized protein YjaG (DUF416 family)